MNNNYNNNNINNSQYGSMGQPLQNNNYVPYPNAYANQYQYNNGHVGNNNNGYEYARLQEMGLMRQYGSRIKAMCLVVIIQNIIYILINVVTYGLGVNYSIMLMALETVLFAVFACNFISDGMAQQHKYRRTRNTLLGLIIAYTIFFIITIILLTLGDSRYNNQAFIVASIVSYAVYLIPKIIAYSCNSDKDDIHHINMNNGNNINNINNMNNGQQPQHIVPQYPQHIVPQYPQHIVPQQPQHIVPQ